MNTTIGTERTPIKSKPSSGRGSLAAAAGVLLTVLGGLLLAGQLAGWAFWPFGAWLTWENAWPLLPIGVDFFPRLLCCRDGGCW
jgi:hypothetical protein